jgi:hypothetical protein
MPDSLEKSLRSGAVRVTKPVSSTGHVNRLKTLPLHTINDTGFLTVTLTYYSR